MIIRRSKAQNRLSRENQLGWLTTFNDLMTLLMVFFVLLFSMGSMDADRFKIFQNGLQSAMGVLDEGRNTVQGIISERQLAVFDRSMMMSQDVQALVRSEGLEAEYTRKGLRLTLREELLFSSGSAILTDEGLKMLGQISATIQPMHRFIRVEGHTDNRSIATLRFPSNWELSTARAISVVTYFIQSGGIDPMLLSAAGYGSSKARVPNDAEEHRALNRRVEIILGRTVKGPDS